MTDLNKIISLFIGLFVVIFLLALVLGRIDVGFPKVDLGGALGEIFQRDEKAEVTPTPTPGSENENVVVVTKAPTTGAVVVVTQPTQKPKPTTSSTTGSNNDVQTSETEKGGQTATEIPATGAGMILPLSAALASLGIMLRKKNLS